MFRLESALLVVAASALVGACGSALPSTAPLSTSARDPMARTRPSSARAVETGSDDTSSVESQPAASGGDDDDDDSTAAPGETRPGTNLISR